jgi:hypothetical protein
MYDLLIAVVTETNSAKIANIVNQLTNSRADEALAWELDRMRIESAECNRFGPFDSEAFCQFASNAITVYCVEAVYGDNSELPHAEFEIQYQLIQETFKRDFLAQFKA